MLGRTEQRGQRLCVLILLNSQCEDLQVFSLDKAAVAACKIADNHQNNSKEVQLHSKKRWSRRNSDYQNAAVCDDTVPQADVFPLVHAHFFEHVSL